MGRPGPNCKPRICKLCGRSYVPTSTHQSCCNQPIEATCKYCGGTFVKKCTTSDSNTCCSEKCLIEYMKIRRAESSLAKPKKCKWCGKEFHAKSVRTVYCDGPHYKKCEVCGKMFELDVKLHRDRRSCSKECLKVLQVRDRDFEQEHENMKKALLEKYGVDNPVKIPGVPDKIKSTTLERYGKEWYTQTDEYKERVRDVSLEKYGTEHWLSSKEIIDKRKETVKAKYGSDNIFSSEYGKRKIFEYWNSNYGIDSSSQLHIKDFSAWKSFQENSVQYIDNHYPEGVTIQQLAHDLGVSIVSIYAYLDEEVFQSKIIRDFSRMETDVSLMLKDIDPDINIHHNRRKLIPPYEIDIYLPDYNIGIECNPAYTHNSSNVNPWCEESMNSRYHLMKTELAESNSIFLIHLFGYQWKHKREIIESIMRNLLKKNTLRIFARNTHIQEVDIEACKEFLNKNHLKGSCNSSVRLGLYYNNDLVYIMVFSKQHKSKKNNYDNEGMYELVRFCSKLNTSVVGGASKLFKYFLSMYSPREIVSYSDRSYTRGNVYSLLRLRQVDTISPDYMWVNPSTEVATPWYNFTTDYLQKLSLDSEDKLKSKVEIIESAGYVRVFDCGKFVWKWNEDTQYLDCTTTP